MKTNKSPLNIRAAYPCNRPAFIPVGRPRGAKAAGIRYERLFKSYLSTANHGQWFEYETIDGQTHYCQTDALVSFLPDLMLVLELKYTLVPDAAIKLRGLYIPVVTTAMGLTTYGAVVSRNLTPNPGPLAYSLTEALTLARTGLIPTLHWVGQPLSPTSPLM